MQKNLAYLCLFILLTACGASPEGDQEETTESVQSSVTLTLLAPEVSPFEEALFGQFTRRTGIEVRVRPVLPAASRSILTENATDADLVWTSDIVSLEKARQAQSLLRVRSDSLRRHIPADSRDKDDHWFGFAKSIWLIVTHRNLTAPPQDYAALKDSTWAKHVLLIDSSFTDYHPLLTTLIAQYGQTEGYRWADCVQENATTDFPEDLSTLLDILVRSPKKVALAQSHSLALALDSNASFMDALQLVFPNQGVGGAMPQLRAAGVLKSSQHPEEAQALLEFLISEQAQEYLTRQGHWYPIRADIPPSDLLQSWGEFEVRVVEWAELEFYQEKAHQVIESVKSLKRIKEEGNKGLQLQ